MVWAEVEGSSWAEASVWADVEGLVWSEVLVGALIGVQVAGSILIPKSTSSLGWRVTILFAGMSGVIGFRVILMHYLFWGGNVSEGAVG